MDKVNDFKLAVTAVVALLTSLWGWFGWLKIVYFIHGFTYFLTR